VPALYFVTTYDLASARDGPDVYLFQPPDKSIMKEQDASPGESSVGRRDFLKTTSLAALSAYAPTELQASRVGGGRGTTPPSAEQPNIVLIYADDLGYASLGCYGNTDIKTPHIDQLAAEGMRMTSFYSASSVCTPSRSSLLTGRYPHRNGLFENIRNNIVNYDHRFKELEYMSSPEMTQGLDTREITIASALSDAGYATGIFGKWDSGRARRFMPLERGFDAFYGFSNTGIDYWTHERYGIPSLYRGNNRIREEGYATNLFRREALNFIDANKDNPFFLYVPFNSPHGASNLDGPNQQAPDEYIKMYGEPPGDEDTRRKANITCLDDAVGALLEKLQEHGLEENTLVIFTTDHGGFHNGALRNTKGTMYEGGLRTPFIARWPGNIPEGVTSDAFCSTLDFFPTFHEIAGASLPEGVTYDGYNMLPVLTDQAESSRDEQFWELRGKRGARVGKWKWVLGTEERWVLPEDETGELFDLSVDPYEENNLAQQRPQVLQEMKNRWDQWASAMATSVPRGPFDKGAYFDLLGGYGDGKYRLSE